MEIVIVEDGKITGELEHVIAEMQATHPDLFRIVALPENVGLGAALRKGVEACRYEWIVRMDADDYSSPRRCELQFEALEKNKADIVGCDVDEFLDTPPNVIARRVFPITHEDICKFSKRRTPFAHPAVIMRKSQVLRVGNYRHAYLHEDYDLFIRLLQSGSHCCSVNLPLVSMRVSPDFYARRGGNKYLKTLLTFNYRQLKDGWMSPVDFLIRSGANTVSCLAPNGLREWIYRRMLRNDSSSSCCT